MCDAFILYPNTDLWTQIIHVPNTDHFINLLNKGHNYHNTVMLWICTANNSLKQ